VIFYGSRSEEPEGSTAIQNLKQCVLEVSHGGGLVGGCDHHMATGTLAI